MYWDETKINIRYSEVDRMNVVHNSRYFIYQEEAKHNFLKKVNLNKKITDENGYFSPVTENRMIYIKPATVWENIYVRVALYEVSTVELKYVSVIFNEKGELLTFGFVSNCISDTSMKPIALKKVDKEEYLRFKKLECKDIIGEISRKNLMDFFLNENYKII